VPQAGNLRTPPASVPETQLAVVLGRSQELLYHGSYTEESLGGNVRFTRSYRIESRLLVLDQVQRGFEVAFLTVLRHKDGQIGPPPRGVTAEPLPASVRLEKGLVDAFGRVTFGPGQRPTVPLDGPPTVETGAFVELPRSRVGSGQPWQLADADPDRPAESWEITGTETVQATRCFVLRGTQQSDGWDAPRADRKAWRRRDTVWLNPRLGFAVRVERVLELREPAALEPTQRSTLRYTLETTVQYPGQLFFDRREEIAQALGFAETARPLLPTPARNLPQLAALTEKINYHLENLPPTPYRPAVLQIKARVEAARRGEVPPSLPAERAPGPRVASLGEPAPEFLIPDFQTGKTTTLRPWLGKPVVLVFYHPASVTAQELLRFAQQLQDTCPQTVQVLGMCVADDRAAALKQRTDWKLTFPILGGGGLRLSYAVETTPKIMILDADGIVRGAYLGWGGETPLEVATELKRWLTAPRGVTPAIPVSRPRQ
jgi:peroxiredoxin